MAILVFGPTVTGIRGTIGGNLFSANKSGPYVRAWSKPTNPKSTKQNSKRNAMGTESQFWQTLTAAQQAGWDTLAADPIMARTNSLGQSYQLSGFQLFLSVNLYRVTTGEVRRTSAPAPSSQTPPTGVSISIRPVASGGSTLTFVPSQIAASKFLVCFLAFGRSQGVLTRFSNFRLLIVADSTDSSPLSITSELDALFGDPQVGYKYFLNAQIQNSVGVRSSVLQVSGVAF